MLRVWLVLGLVAPAMGMGAWAKPAAAARAPVVELGLHAGPEAHGDPAEHSRESPVSTESSDAKDAEDDFRERTSVAPLWLAPTLDLDLHASVARHLFADERGGEAGRAHRGSLHNRGPPRA